MSKMIVLSAILAVSAFAQSDSTNNKSGIFQALKQTDGGFNLGNWDGSQILSQKGDVLAIVSIKDGKLDFSRAAGQARADLLKSLYKLGLRKVHFSAQQFLVVAAEGHIGPAPPQNGLFQALKEMKEGFDLNSFEQSSIIDSSGKLLGSLGLRDGRAILSPAPGQTLETLYELGLRSLFIKSGEVVRLIKDDGGEVVLKGKEG